MITEAISSLDIPRPYILLEAEEKNEDSDTENETPAKKKQKPTQETIPGMSPIKENQQEVTSQTRKNITVNIASLGPPAKNGQASKVNKPTKPRKSHKPDEEVSGDSALGTIYDKDTKLDLTGELSFEFYLYHDLFLRSGESQTSHGAKWSRLIHNGYVLSRAMVHCAVKTKRRRIAQIGDVCAFRSWLTETVRSFPLRMPALIRVYISQCGG
jgi:hypothetical protein